MNNYRIRIPSTAQLRALESEWIKTCHQNWGAVLMEQAGSAAADVAQSICEDRDATVVVFCGRGNNGGDGFVVARHLHLRGYQVVVFLVNTGSNKPSAGSFESNVNKDIYEKLGMQVHSVSSSDLEGACGATSTADLIVDALLGTGLDRNVEGIYADLIEIINESGVPVLSIDLPSGINSDNGQVMGDAVAADATVTFGYLKAGLLNYPGAYHAGSITVVNIGLPSIDFLPPPLQSLSKTVSSPRWWLANHRDVWSWLPPRSANSHKGTFGRLLSLAGCYSMPGAALLSSKSALRTGVGLSVLAAVKSVINHLPPGEVIYKIMPETGSGSLALKAAAELKKELDEASAVLIGPGLSSDEETGKLVRELVAGLDKPCIVDADGLNAISDARDTIKLKHAERFVFTPHPKELSRLMNMPVAAIQADRLGAAEKAVAKYGCNVLLKGAHTVVATTEGDTYIIPTGNAGMATAGAGDVLSGIIGALLAQGVSSAHAAVAGAYIHGAAGDLAAELIGEDGLVAGDIMDAVPDVLKLMREGQFVGTYLEDEARL